MTNEGRKGGGFLSYPWPQLGKLSLQSPGFSGGGDSEGQGDQVSGKWFRGGETPRQETRSCPGCCAGAPTAQGHRAEQTEGGRPG